MQSSTLAVQQGSYRYAYEIDILGRDIRRWFGKRLTAAPCDDSIPVDVDMMHHAFVEIIPETGELVDQLVSADLLDPERIGYLSLGGFRNDKYAARMAEDESGPDVTRDWSHANALEFLPEQNAVLVSFRHLDCILKITGKQRRIFW